jgi:hypothetical protein
MELVTKKITTTVNGDTKTFTVQEPANDEIVRYCGTNRYADICSHCGRNVPADHGDLFRDDYNERWIVIHKANCKRMNPADSNWLPLMMFTAFVIFIAFALS